MTTKGIGDGRELWQVETVGSLWCHLSILGLRMVGQKPIKLIVDEAEGFMDSGPCTCFDEAEGFMQFNPAHGRV